MPYAMGAAIGIGVIIGAPVVATLGLLGLALFALKADTQDQGKAAPIEARPPDKSGKDEDGESKEQRPTSGTGHDGSSPEPDQDPERKSPQDVPPTPPGGSLGSPDDQDEAERKRSWDAAVEIAMGHAYEEHVELRGEFPRITNRRQYAEFIHRIMLRVRKTKDYKHLPNSGRRAYWDEQTRTLVIEDPLNPNGGTAYRPGSGRKAFEALRDR